MRHETNTTHETAGDIPAQKNRKQDYEIGYILAGSPGLSARKIFQRSLEEPQFLRKCERVLFGRSLDKRQAGRSRF